MGCRTPIRQKNGLPNSDSANAVRHIFFLKVSDLFGKSEFANPLKVSDIIGKSEFANPLLCGFSVHSPFPILTSISFYPSLFVKIIIPHKPLRTAVLPGINISQENIYAFDVCEYLSFNNIRFNQR